jgi:Sigma-54 interaction domain
MHMDIRTARERAVTTVVSAALSSARSQDLISALEWECLSTGGHNVLLEGPEDSTSCLVRLLEPHLRRPVLWQPLPAPFAVPAGESGVLVLQNIGALSRHQQADLLRWLGDLNGNGRTQIVSTTASPLFPLVERGLFEEALYYRLNVMLLCVGPADTPE